MAKPDQTSAAQALFACDVHHDGDRVVVAPSGELDLATVDQLETEIRRVCASDATAVVLDLRALSFMDSTGLRLLVQMDQLARAREMPFSVDVGDGAAFRLLELTRLLDRFPAPGANGSRR